MKLHGNHDSQSFETVNFSNRLCELKPTASLAVILVETCSTIANAQ